MGKNWEDLPAPSATLADLDEDSIHKFLKKAIAQKRIPPDAMEDGIATLLENLHLLTIVDTKSKTSSSEGLRPSLLLLWGKCRENIQNVGKMSENLAY